MSAARAPFGNHPDKIARYQAFWKRSEVARPLVGFSLVGWFPLQEFAACRAWGAADYATPDMIDPADFVPDHLRMLHQEEAIEDDLIRGACPGQVAIPWLPGIVGARVRILPQNILGEEQNLGWDEALKIRLDRDNGWFRKYLEFSAALVRAADGRFPVSHAAEIGPTDLHAVLRGHSQSLLDLSDEPEKSQELLYRMAEIFIEFAEEFWRRAPLFHGGYFDAQYSLWAPGPIVRMQEDATAVYSPSLYRKFVLPVDRMIAARFANSFIHLHSTSMFLLEAFLECREIQAFEVNHDACGPPLVKMLPHFSAIQRAGKPLLIRGSFLPDEMRLLLGSLDARGLFLNAMVKGMAEVEALQAVVGC